MLMKKKIKFISIALFCYCAASTANQKNVITNNDKGIYIGANMGINDNEWNDFNGWSWNETLGITWDADLGYQFNRYFALETNYINAKFFSDYSVLARGIIPINSKYNFFGKLGYAIEANEPIVGFGLSYRITPKFSLVGEGSWIVNRMTRATLGLQYKFNL